MSNNTYRPMDFLRRFSVGSDNTPSNTDATQGDASPPADRTRRRNFSRRANSNGDLNPQATDFVPSSRTPSKRKASSSVRGSKSTAGRAPEHAVIPYAGTPHDPAIKGSEIFQNVGFQNVENAAPARVNKKTVAFSNIYSDTLPTRDLSFLENLDVYSDDMAEILEDATGFEYMPSTRTAGAFKISQKNARNNSPSKDEDTVTSAVIYTTAGSRHGTNDRASTSLAWMNYLPLALAGSINRSTPLGSKVYKILPSCRRQMDVRLSRLPFDSLIWPINEMPMELFELIADYLPQDDVKAMRLVNKEFESKVSPSLFRSAVVPFNTELYDMIDEDTKSGARGAGKRNKGKGKARGLPAPLDGSAEGMRLHWKNAREDEDNKVYRGHGLKVFEGFGPHIRRFGMSFEVSEAQLNQPPSKKELNEVNSYHGKYEWPPHHYTRFANLAGLENTADETSRMVSAFSKLVNAQELGLSIDSGLGRLNGLDVSTHSAVFTRPHPIFNPDSAVHSHATGAYDLWSALKKSHATVGGSGTSLKEQTMRRRSIDNGMNAMPGLRGSLYSNPELWPTAQAKKAGFEASRAVGAQDVGVISTTPSHLDPTEAISMTSPTMLRREQKEWLLETEWAQRAFLESYILAVVDNRTVFRGVTTLNLAKISSGLLPILGRETFWNAFPKLENVTLCVHPDWRTVARDSAGYAETMYQQPSQAAGPFFHLIATHIAPLTTVKKLRLGYTDGGENSPGLFARNANLMPAPVIAVGHSTLASPSLCVRFPHLEELELYNCWITPPALELLVHSHADLSLKHLVLDSVSLTAHPRNAHNGGGNAGVGAAAAALVAANLTGLQAQQAFLQNMQANPVLQQSPANATNNQFVIPTALHLPNAPPANIQNWATTLPQLLQAPAAPAPPPVTIPASLNTNPSHWATTPRPGSWPQILDAISPGPRLADYLPAPPPWADQPPPRPPTALRKLTLKSCGYARLAVNHFDQSLFDSLIAREGLSAWFKQRQAALAPGVMTSQDGWLGRVVQGLPSGEGNALLFGWRLVEGWEDGVAAEGVEFDGLATGGRGRVRGTIWQGMGLVGRG